jgi:hypothetical protein
MKVFKHKNLLLAGAGVAAIAAIALLLVLPGMLSTAATDSQTPGSELSAAQSGSASATSALATGATNDTTNNDSNAKSQVEEFQNAMANAEAAAGSAAGGSGNDGSAPGAGNGSENSGTSGGSGGTAGNGGGQSGGSGNGNGDSGSGNGTNSNPSNSDPQPLTCNLTIDSITYNGATIMATRQVSFSEGETVFDVLKRECQNSGIHLEFSFNPLYSSAYIEGIANIYEFDGGETSGWMYKVNGWYPNYGCSQYKLQTGDTIEWRYTCALGADIGGRNVLS